MRPSVIMALSYASNIIPATANTMNGSSSAAALSGFIIHQSDVRISAAHFIFRAIKIAMPSPM